MDILKCRIEKEEVPAISWKRFVETYEESLNHVHDESSFYVHGKIVKYSKNAFGMLNNKTKFRFALVWVVTSKWFENLVILLIMINSIILGMKDYTDAEDKTYRNRFVK